MTIDDSIPYTLCKLEAFRGEGGKNCPAIFQKRDLPREVAGASFWVSEAFGDKRGRCLDVGEGKEGVFY